jgi:hypothetical protein
MSLNILISGFDGVASHAAKSCQTKLDWGYQMHVIEA